MSRSAQVSGKIAEKICIARLHFSRERLDCFTVHRAKETESVVECLTRKAVGVEQNLMVFAKLSRGEAGNAAFGKVPRGLGIDLAKKERRGERTQRTARI